MCLWLNALDQTFIRNLMAVSQLLAQMDFFSSIQIHTFMSPVTLLPANAMKGLHSVQYTLKLPLK